MAIGILLGTMLSTGKDSLLGQNSNGGNFSKVQDIIQILDNYYVDSIKQEELFEQTISDMLHKLDPHSNYIPAKDMQQANEQLKGQFGGVGIRFAMIRDTLSVTHVIDNSPSYRAGVKAGDRILSVDNTTIAHKKLATDRIMGMLKGQEGTVVNVNLLRGNKQLKKRIIRGTIPIESIVSVQMLTPTVGYIRLESFSLTSAQEFEQAAARLLSQGMKKLIFDLRDNGGGVLGGATQIADQFLRDGLGIVAVKGVHQRPDRYIATGKGLLENVQLAVMINSNSASASEIFAGAIQDNDRGTIIGRRSFGKGLVQQDFQLKDGSNLRLTIARYYMPSGRCIQKEFDGNIDNYYQDQYEREANGELFAPDSMLTKKSKKYKTRKGRTVYGGVGVIPDVFVPIDTSNSTYYFAQLRYSPAFQHFAFDFVSNKRSNWKSFKSFNTAFNPTDELVNAFVTYAEKEHAIPVQKKELAKSMEMIRRSLKAEIARQLFVEEGYFGVVVGFDKEIQKALKVLN